MLALRLNFGITRGLAAFTTHSLDIDNAWDEGVNMRNCYAVHNSVQFNSWDSRKNTCKYIQITYMEDDK